MFSLKEKEGESILLHAFPSYLFFFLSLVSRYLPVLRVLIKK